MSHARFRPTASKTPLRYDTTGHPLCRFCQKPVPFGRLTFCSSKCVHEWKIRTSGQYVRECLLKRDKGICAHCRKDCISARNALIKKPKDYFSVPEQWEANHKIPVFRGKGDCGLDNYETLCLKCHAAITSQQRKERDATRRRKQMVAILRFIEHESVTGATATEIVTATGLSDTSVYKYLQRLRCKWGYIAQSRKGAPYVLTEKGKAAFVKVERAKAC
jgi:predicted transcriptional regulator